MRYNDIIKKLVNLQNALFSLQARNVLLSHDLFENKEAGQSNLEILNQMVSKIDQIEDKECEMRKLAQQLHIKMKISDFAEIFCKKLNAKVYPYVFDINVKNVYPSSAGFHANQDVIIASKSYLQQKKYEHILDLVSEGVYKKKDINNKMNKVDTKYVPDEILCDFSQGQYKKLDLNTDLGRLVYSIGCLPLCSKEKYNESCIDILADSLETSFQIIPKGFETICEDYLIPNNQPKVKDTPENLLFSSILKEILIDELEKTKDEDEINVEAQQAFPVSPNLK